MLPSAETDIVATDVDGHPVLRRVLVRVTAGPDAGFERALEQGTIVVGKAGGCDLVLHDRKVSRQHCELALLPTGVRVRDLGSTNGTKLKGARVESIVAEPPFEIELGQTRLALTPADLPLPELSHDRTSLGPFVARSEAGRAVIALLGRVAQRPVPVWVSGPEGAGKTTALEGLVREAGAPWRQVPRIDLRTAGEEEVRDVFDEGPSMVHLDHVDRVRRDAQDALIERLGADPSVVTLSESREDPRELVEAGSLSRELFFRAAVVRASLPALDARTDDVPAIARAIGQIIDADPDAVREAVTRALAGGLTRGAWTLRDAILSAAATATAPSARGDTDLTELPFKEAKARVLEDFGRDYVATLLARHGGNLTAAAKEAGIARNHLAALAKKYGVR